MREKIAFVVATPLTAKAFLLHHFQQLSRTYDVYLIANFTDEKTIAHQFENITVIDAPIQRQVSIWLDLKSIIVLFKLFRQHKFDIVHSVTPKAGLLAMTSSLLAGIKYRFHTFTGQVWATQGGMKRLFFKTLDKVLNMAAYRVLVDSASQRRFLIAEGVTSNSKSSVLANGSISGVNAQAFFSNSELKAQSRTEFGLSSSDFVFMFLGRVNPEKGIAELIAAFKQLSKEPGRTAMKLLIVGPDETNMLSDLIESNIVVKGYTDSPNKCMAAADVFCLPSHREGFGSVIIEAAASGLPAIGSDIYGVNDAIQDGVTGLLHKVKDQNAIADCMRVMMDDHQTRQKLGDAAKNRAVNDFSQATVTAALCEFYTQVCTGEQR